ncbi:MAG: 5-formyltetrahydrofolate cyclo-ligase [Euryarchaeota archaeon]|nr:5-formyltetrahydrofolate cyclo-ligase [Euryarchaeota archaeon]
MERSFSAKDDARRTVWDALKKEKVARFPFPPHGRIPNFKDAEKAAERLFGSALWKNVEQIKANPDAPQRPVRERALRECITVYMPTPRLKGGFKKIDPSDIPGDSLGDAATLTKSDRWAETVALSDLPEMDLVVCGSVAVTKEGRRAGKGEGYSDLEYAILKELGHPDVPVVTTVHDLQVVDKIPVDEHDIPLTLIATPTGLVRVKDPPEPPKGIDWSLLSEKDLDEMPVLKELQKSA